MRKLLTILFVCLLPSLTKGQPVADAGADQTIYLTQGNSVTLTGTATNRSMSLWREVSTDYSSGATISNAGSLTTTVSGLPQGTFYFELAVTSPTSVVKRDTVTINVDYAPAPGTLLRNLEMSNSAIVNLVNNHSDTSQLTGGDASLSTSQGDYFFDRNRSLSMTIDNQKAKFYSTIEDGYHWQGSSSYARTEIHWGSYWALDSNKTYVFEWKGYFPQDFSYLATGSEALAILQIHGLDNYSPAYAFYISQSQGLTIRESSINNSNGSSASAHIADLSDLVNETHTIRMTLREGKGYIGQNAFIKVEMDGVQKYLRNTGNVGATFQHDYPKFASLYDYRRVIVDPSNESRGRKFSLVTESFTIYELSDIQRLRRQP